MASDCNGFEETGSDRQRTAGPGPEFASELPESEIPLVGLSGPSVKGLHEVRCCVPAPNDKGVSAKFDCEASLKPLAAGNGRTPTQNRDSSILSQRFLETQQRESLVLDVARQRVRQTTGNSLLDLVSPAKVPPREYETCKPATRSTEPQSTPKADPVPIPQKPIHPTPTEPFSGNSAHRANANIWKGLEHGPLIRTVS